MAPRRRPTSPVKPALNAGLTLYVGDRVESDWVRLILAEKEVEGARIKHVKPGSIDEDLVLLNPSQTLPTVIDREGTLTNAAVIAEYLDERYPHPALMPVSPAERARMRLVLLTICGEIFPMVPAGGQAFPVALQRALRDQLEPVAQQIGAKRWFMGFDYNLVDCAWSALLRRARPADLKTLPAIAAYAQRLAARPAFKRSIGALA